MQASEFAEIILASFDDDLPAAIFDNLLDGLSDSEACVALNLTLAAKRLFAVPLNDGGLLMVNEKLLELPDSADLKDALRTIVVEGAFKEAGKEHLF